MAYIDVITLAEAKLYLRIDDTLTEDDLNITRMINSALSFVEKWTNVMVYKREITYFLKYGRKRIYDAPVNSVVTTDPVVYSERGTLYTEYWTGTESVDIVLDVGYELATDVPEELREVAFQIIDILYYKAGNNKPIAEQLNGLAIDMLNQNKRFIM